MSEAQATSRDSMLSEAGMDQYLTFILADEEYGLNIHQVLEIRNREVVTVIPNTPDYILGVINLRGTVVPILDLRKRFNLEATEFDKSSVIIIVKIVREDKEHTMGLVVDAVSEVYKVAEEMVRPSPDFGGVISTDFVKGLATVNDKMIILLEINQLIIKGILENIDEVVEKGEKAGS